MPPFLPQYKLMYWQLVAHFFLFVLATFFLPNQANEIFLIVFDFVAVFSYLQGLKVFMSTKNQTLAQSLAAHILAQLLQIFSFE